MLKIIDGGTSGREGFSEIAGHTLNAASGAPARHKNELHNGARPKNAATGASANGIHGSMLRGNARPVPSFAAITNTAKPNHPHHAIRCQRNNPGGAPTAIFFRADNQT